MHRNQNLTAGIALGLASAAAGALLPIVTRYGALHIDPLLFCAGSALVAAACAMPLLGAGDGFGVLLDPRYRRRLAALSMVGTFVPSLAMIYGMRRLSATSGVLLLQVEPIYSLGVAMLVVGEMPAPRQLMATALILVGIFSAFWTGSGLGIGGAAFLVLLTPMMWQFSHAISLRVMPPLSPVSISAARNCHAAVLLAALLAVTSPASLAQLRDFHVIATLLVTGAIVYFLGTLTWYGAISRLSLSWTTALVVPGTPVLAILFAVTFLGERPAARQLIAIGIAVAGILALVLGSNPARVSAARIEAIEAPAPPGI